MASGMPWLEDAGMRKLELKRSEVSYVLGYSCIFGFLWLVLNWKYGQKLGDFLVINQILAIWGQWLQKLSFSILDCY